MAQMLPHSKILATFTTENIVKRSLDALFVSTGNSRKIYDCRTMDKATVNAPFRAWASPLLSYSTRQCEKPPVVGQQRVEIPALSCVIPVRGGDHGQ